VKSNENEQTGCPNSAPSRQRPKQGERPTPPATFISVGSVGWGANLN